MSASDPYAQRRAQHQRDLADRNAQAAENKRQAAEALAPLQMSLDPSGLPSCDECGCLIAPSRVRLHRDRCK